MEARILKKVKRRAALCATCAAASLLAACSSTQEAAPEEPSYRSPYQSYRSLCVVPAEEHSASFDLTLARMLRDRGFEPELLETRPAVGAPLPGHRHLLDGQDPETL